MEALKYVFGAKTLHFPHGYASLAMRNLDKRYNNKDEIDQEELQLKFDKAKLGRKNPFDFERDMSEIRRKLEKDYQIIKTEKEYTQKLINCVNFKEYEFEKRMLRSMQRNKTLTSKLWVDELMVGWSENFKKDEENNNNNNDKRRETNLTNRGKFHGKCNNCGIWGHKKS